MSDLIQVQDLRPFTKFCCTIGNLPSSYLVSMTYEEQLLWLCNYLQNTVIPTVNNNAEAVEELQNLYVQLKNYVDNYFTNLDVQEEINNKLDEMATDGTLAKIINEEIFNELNNKINNKLNIDNIFINNDNLFVGVFGSEHTNKPNFLRFYITKDLKTLSPLSYLPLEIGTNSEKSIDVPTADMIYVNGTFYLLSGHSAGKGTIDLYTSIDLTNWQKNSYDLLPTMQETAENWAPKWFIDSDGTIYITLSIRNNSLSQEDKYIQEQYIAKINSLNPFTFNNAQPLNLPFPLSSNKGSQYDGYMFKNQETYYFWQRRQYAGDDSNYDHIEYYKGSSLDSLVYQGIVNCFENVQKCEAPYVKQSSSGEFYIYADYSGDGQGTFYATSADLENWSNALPLNTPMATRHGCFCKVPSEIGKNFLLKETSNSNYQDQVHFNSHYINIESCIKNNIFYPIAVPNITYYVDQNRNVEINSIDTANIDFINFFNVVLWGENNNINASLKINGSLVNPLNITPITFEGWEYLKCPITFYNSGRKTWCADYNIYHRFLKNKYKYPLNKLNPVSINQYLDDNKHISELPLYNGIVYTCNYSSEISEITVDSYKPMDFIPYMPYDIYFLMYSDQNSHKLILNQDNNSYLIPDVGNTKTFSGDTDGNKFIHYTMPIGANYLQLRRQI